MFKRKVILSFDYELFFGDRSGTVLKTLIEPTNKLLEVMDLVGFKGNFFVDWQMLKYLKATGTKQTDSDYALIESQLKDIVNRGHRIELHIHPHWVDAKYNGDGTWDFSVFRHYSLNSFSEEEVATLFKEGVVLLTNIIHQVEPKYNIVAFRAGGWAAQPFDKIKKGMALTGISIDSSVMSHIGIKTDYYSCDYLTSPEPREGYYRFSNDVCIIDEHGLFIEVPISSVNKTTAMKVVGRLGRSLKVNFSPLTDGVHTRSKDNPDIWFNPENRKPCTFSTTIPVNAALMRWQSNADILCFIDHPKDLTEQTCVGIKKLSLVASSTTYKELLEGLNGSNH